MKFACGDKVKDRITGYTGIVVATTTWINGCHRYVIQAQELKDGKPVDSHTFDEQELQLVQANALNLQQKPAEPVSKTGGPTP